MSVLVWLQLDHVNLYTSMIKIGCVNPSERVHSYCSLPFRRLRINHIGDASHCCFQKQPIGNIFSDGVLSAWRSELSRSIQETAKNKQLHSNCQNWGACPFLNVDLGPKVMEWETHKNHSHPIGLELELPPTHCNIGGLNPTDDTACIFCPRASESYRNTPHFNENRFDEVLDAVKFLMPYLQELTILGVAEPFWKNATFDALDRLGFKKHNYHAQFWTFTNGTTFNQKTAEKFLEYVDHSLLNFSIDAAKPKTYKQLRKLDLYETVKRNVKYYVSIRDKKKHAIKICHNINKLNFRELPLMVEEAAEMGADEIYFNLTHDAAGFVDLSQIGLTESDRNEFNIYKKKAMNAQKRSGINITAYRTFDQVFSKKEPDLVQIELKQRRK